MNLQCYLQQEIWEELEGMQLVDTRETDYKQRLAIIFDNIDNAGSIFIGPYSCEAFGDYVVGTNHILPTYGSSKFASGLGVTDFLKRISYVYL